MAECKNQHYVPKFYFKYFNDGKACINMMLKNNGRIILNVSIADQCSKSYFYGNVHNEKNVIKPAEDECKHIWDLVKKSNMYNLSIENIDSLFFSIYFQYSRTNDLAIYRSSVNNIYAKEVFNAKVDKHFVENSSLKEKSVLNKLKQEAKISINEKYCRQLNILLSEYLYIAISDLNICLLKNKTNISFIFSDSPVVFYNMYNNDAVRLLNSGLMIFFPLDNETVLLLHDQRNYDANFTHGLYCHEMIDDSDVININKLQIHQSASAIYFSTQNKSVNITNYWSSEKEKFKSRQDYQNDLKANDNFKVIKPISYDNLELSFIKKRIDRDISSTCRAPYIMDYLIANPYKPNAGSKLVQIDYPLNPRGL